MNLKKLFPGLLILISVYSFAQQSDQPVWIDAGVASVDITPDAPMALTGYGGRLGVYDSVVQRINAKALALGSDAQGPVIVITMDLIGFPASLSDGLAARLKKAGISRSQVAVTATHTHNGPETGVLLNIPGSPQTGQQLYSIKAYRDQLEMKLEKLVLAALATREPCQIDHGKGSAAFAVNRRMIENGKWVGFGMNDGPAEHDLPVLRVRTKNGNLKGILLNYACHGTTLVPKHNFIHGDWMGDAQNLIEKNNPGSVAMVVIGCGADSNPQPREELIYTAQHGKTIADEVQRVINSGTLKPIRNIPNTSFEKLELEFDKIPTESDLKPVAEQKDVAGMVARNYLEQLARGEKISATYNYPVQVWSFGNDLTMVFLGGEVVVDYVKRMKQEFGPDNLWMNAYANDISCYIASRRLYDEGGYEVDFSMIYYNKPSRFKADTESKIISGILRQIQQTQVKFK